MPGFLVSKHVLECHLDWVLQEAVQSAPNDKLCDKPALKSTCPLQLAEQVEATTLRGRGSFSQAGSVISTAGSNGQAVSEGVVGRVDDTLSDQATDQGFCELWPHSWGTLHQLIQRVNANDVESESKARDEDKTIVGPLIQKVSLEEFIYQTDKVS
jgi:hypothetical protein